MGLKEPPTPQEIPIPSVRGVWIFYGVVLQNGTLYSDQLVLKRFLSEPLEPPFSEPWKQTKIANNAVNDPMSKVGMAKKKPLSFVSLMTSRLLNIMLALFQAF